MQGSYSTPAELKGVKLFLAMPVYGGVDVAVVNSLIKADRAMPFPYTLKLLSEDSHISRARNRLAADFLEGDSTHLLFVDSDIVFEPEHIFRLLTLGEDIVGGLYAVKGGDEHWCLNCAAERRDGTLLREVRYIGGGFMLIARRVFTAMIDAFGDQIRYKSYLCSDTPVREEYNFFGCGVVQTPEAPRFLSEDWFFCAKAGELGFRVYADTLVRLHHCGRAWYPLDDKRRAEMWRLTRTLQAHAEGGTQRTLGVRSDASLLREHEKR